MSYETVFPNESAYNVVIKLTFYHCGDCRGHTVSMAHKVHAVTGAEQAREQAALWVRQHYPGYAVTIEDITLSAYSPL